jgi:deoxyribodipyrimidine photo-lyase
MVNKNRIHFLNRTGKQAENIVYWMSRDQRVNNNWSLLYTKELAERFQINFAVVFCLSDEFLEATIRQYDFMLEGLNELSLQLQLKNIPFYLQIGDPVKNLTKFITEFNITHVITDFDPLRIKRKWQDELIQINRVEMIEIDSHNIVPARFVSDKVEYGAYTLRPKIKKHLPEFLDEFPKLTIQKQTKPFSLQQINWTEINKTLRVNRKVQAIDWLHSGEDSANDMLQLFISEKLIHYDEKRNDPNEDGVSNLSPYLHFGQISAQAIVINTLKSNIDPKFTEGFLEELIIRRELADNFCLNNTNYDKLEGFPIWAQETLNIHRKDEREYTYELPEFEEAKTHDPLWNAAQTEMVISGKMHGYLRMYWAKKILEWSATPEAALKTAIFLNDKYELDGRDPNGYAGCAWSIGGVHDRAWQERPVYGKIRYMNFNGAKRKFNVTNFINKWKI